MIKHGPELTFERVVCLPEIPRPPGACTYLWKCQKYVALIECSASVVPYKLDRESSQNDLEVRKVMINKNVAGHLAKSHYPQAEIVRDLDFIIDDKMIELVIISENGKVFLDQVSRALRVGKLAIQRHKITCIWQLFGGI